MILNAVETRRGGYGYGYGVMDTVMVMDMVMDTVMVMDTAMDQAKMDTTQMM